MKDVSILIPFTPDNGYRDHIFKWILRFYENQLPETEICIGGSNSKLFSRSQAINNAASKATKEIFVIADADLIYDPTIINAYIELLNSCSWVVPYYSIDYLTQASTDKLLKTSPNWPIEVQVDANRINLEGITGGLCIVSRKNFEYVGGYDTRFKGWGGEDDAFGFTMNTLCGQYKRLHSQIFHLWHPNKWSSGNPHYEKNFKLFRKYKSCNGKKTSMKKLIKEKKNYSAFEV